VAGVVVLLVLTTAACGAVDVPDSSVSAAERKACESLVEALPVTVADQSRRETSGNPLGAAWGDPAIVLRCGAGTPEDYDKFAGCQTVNGLDWFVPTSTVEDQDADVVMTTIGRMPAVEVVVPASYRPPDAVMVDVGRAIKQHTRVTRRCS
jgi:Protein of unknown function (DUF3515)